MPSWVVRKQLFYLFIVIIVVAGVLFFVWMRLTAPTCSDYIQNQEEEGIDCGGPCAKQCLGEIKDLNIVWSRALDTGDGKYDIVALIENPNLYLSIPLLKYKFSIYGKNNVFISSKEGDTFVSPGNTFPIFAAGVDLGSKKPASVSVDFLNGINWQRTEMNKPQLVVSRKNFSNMPSPRLNVLVENKSFLPSPDFMISAVLYDKNKNAMGASVAKADSIVSGGSAEVVFTWPKSFDSGPDSIEIFFNGENL